MLFCNRVGHQQKEITNCCTKRTCTQSAACCQMCMHEYHSVDHQIPDFILLDNLTNNDWLNPIIKNLQGTLDQLQTNFSLFHQGIQDLINKANIYLKYQQEPSLANLNKLCKTNKCQDVISIQLNNLNQQLQEINININEQFYKSLKLITKVSPIYRFATEEHNQNDKGFIRSHLLFIEKRFREVKKIFEQNKKVDFTLRHQLNKAITYLKLNQPKNSLELIKFLHEKYPQNLKVISKKSLILGEIINAKNALQFLEYSATLDPYKKLRKNRGKLCFIILAQLLDKLVQYNEATSEIQQAINHNPNNDRLIRIKASILNSNKFQPHAIQCLDQAIYSNPKNPENYLFKAKLLHSQNRKLEAIECVDKAIELQPCNPWHYLLKADLKCAKGFQSLIMIQIKAQADTTEDIIKLCENAVNLDYNNVQIRLAYAKLLSDMMRYESANRQYEEAIKLDTTCSDSYLEYAKALNAVNKYQQSIEWLNQAIIQDPGNLELCQMKVDNYLKMNQFKEANGCCDEFLKLVPNEYSLYGLKGLCMLKMDKFDEALNYYNYALDLYQDVSLYIAKIRVLIEKQDISAAQQEYQKAEKLYPDNAELKELKDKLVAKNNQNVQQKEQKKSRIRL